MADLQGLFNQIDSLSPQEFERLYRYIHKQRRTQRVWWVVPPENLAAIKEILRPVHEQAAEMTEEEINVLIDEALAEVRRESPGRERGSLTQSV
jgi:hypothetical protein